MPRTLRRAFTIAVLILGALVPAVAAPGLPGKALVQVFLRDLQADLDDLRRGGFDVAYVDRKAGTADVVVTPDALDEIKRKGYAVRVLQVSRRGAPDFGARAEGAELVEVDPLYKDYNEIFQILRTAEQTYPTIAKRYLIGGSQFPRAMYALKISDNVTVDEDETTILFDGQHHAREPMSTEVVLDIIEYLTTRYATDVNVQRWVNNHEIWLVPSVNPDGNVIVFTQDDFWRKNIRDNNGNGTFDASDGVDLNRNYPFNWGGACNGSSSSPSAEDYRGPYSASEPELTAMLGLERGIHPVFSIDYHSYAEEVYYAYGCNPSIAPRLTTIQPPTPDQNLARLIGEQIGSRIVQADGGLGFAVAPSAYGIDGNSRDHQYHEIGTLSFVIEVNSSGEGGFLPNYNLWRNPTVQGQRPGWQYLLDRLDGSGIGGRVTSSVTGLPLLAEVSLDEMTNYAGEVYYSEPDFGRYHFVVVPGTYHVRARAPGYAERVVAVTVGASVESADVALDPAPGVVLFRDDLEAPGTWTVGGVGDDATQGQWVRGDPYGSFSGTYPGVVTWAAPEFDRSVQRGINAYVTGNPQNPSFGAGDVDGGVTSLVSPAVDASALYGVQATYARRFYKSGADAQDAFTADVSNDGGLSWTQLEQLTATTTSATQSPAYVTAGFLLDAKLPLTANLKLRFRAADRNADSTVEAAVDELQVTGIPRTAAALGDLRVDGGASTVISFSSAPGEPTYDVVRGDLSQLRIQGAQVDLGQVICIEENSANGTTAEFPDAATPETGLGFFYLARFNLGYSVGSYGQGTGAMERVPDPLFATRCSP